MIDIEIVFDCNKGNSILSFAENTDLFLNTCKSDSLNYISRLNQKYRSISINQYELYILRHYLYNFIKSLSDTFFKFELDKIYIIKLSDEVENGFPHTRALNVICYSNINHIINNGCLFHELIHIHQKNYPEYWNSILNNLKWKQYSDKQIPDNLNRLRRINPDTIHCPYWIFNNTWIPIPIYKNYNNPKINQVKIIFYNQHTHMTTENIPDEMHVQNIPYMAYEHPYEMIAYIMTNQFHLK